MKKFLCLLVSFLIFLSQGSFATSAPSCGEIFQARLSAILETANSERDGLLFPNLDTHLQSISSSRKKVYRKLIRELESLDPENPEQVEDFSSRLMLTLFGPRDTLTRWLSLSREERIKDSTYRSLRKKVIKEGIVASLSESAEFRTVEGGLRATVKRWYWEHLRTPRMNTLWRYLGNILRFPVGLPEFQSKEMPAELMEKILLDGLDPHWSEVLDFYRIQNRIENYQVIRKVYFRLNITVLSALISFTSWQIYSSQRHEQQENLSQIVEQSKLLTEKFGADVRANLETIRKETLQRTLIEFRNKWGEDPTPDEYQIIVSRIWKEL